MWKGRGIYISKLALKISLLGCPKVRSLLFRGDVVYAIPQIGRKISINMSWTRRYAVAKRFAIGKKRSYDNEFDDPDLWEGYNFPDVVPVVFMTKAEGRLLNLQPYCEEEEVIVDKCLFRVRKVKKINGIYHVLVE